MRWLKRLSIKYKILLIPVVGILGFALNIGINGKVNSENAERMSEIRDIYFPVLETADKMIVYLAEITDSLNSAVSTGEADSVDDADVKAGLLKVEFDEVVSLYPDKGVAIKVLQDSFDAYFNVAREMSVAMVEGTADFSALQAKIVTMKTALETIQNEMQAFRQGSYDEFNATLDRTVAESADAMMMSLLASAITVGILLIVSVSIAVMITRNIGAVVNSLKKMASGDGDLTQRIDQSSEDEIGELVAFFNSFIEKLQSIMSQVIESIDPLVTVSGELNGLAKSSTATSTSQLETISEVAHAISQVFDSVNDVATSASSAATAAQEADLEAKSGLGILEETVNAINQLAVEVETACGTNKQLENDTESVSSILDVIQGIAEQTNLLALNAAIEAARAGEHGRGFAVVADEVRTLASKTQESTKEIQTVIEQLQRTARSITEVMEQGQQSAKQSVDYADKTGGSLAEVGAKIASISDMNFQIASATEEQQRTSQTINKNVEGIRDGAESSVGVAGNVADLTESLGTVTGQLKSVARQFKV
ncbi:MAG: methyl-accepting chemotaxis protein [Gammaproteobacteria bacterium]|nr:methyl-accepting chemotaxis protein [Gammaproteobacteria bacterium]